MSLFARQALRPARTLQQQVRRYASEAPQSSGGSGNVTWGLIGLLVGGGGFYLYNQYGGAVPAAKELAGKVGVAVSKPAFTGGDQGFLSLKLKEVEIVNHNVKKLRFELPEADQVSGLHVASAVLTKYKGPEQEKPTVRPYTPISDTDEKGHLDFIIKKYPDGPMSSHLHDMVPGQRLDIKGPLPKYPWSPNKHEHVVMIAGGTGITPMWQVANAIFQNPADNTKVTLVFGNVSEDDILLKKEFEHLENTFPQRFRAFYVLDNPPKDWNGGKGHVTKELIKTVSPDPLQGDKIKIFVCGPPGLYKAISGGKKSPQDQGELTGILAELGYTKEQVYKF